MRPRRWLGGLITCTPAAPSRCSRRCGALPIFWVSGQFSFEERMACGFGACMAAPAKTKYGSKRICKDGPVLFKEEIQW